MSGAAIARVRRRSRGYVSILVRLGRALAACTPEELAALRSPRITWKVAQRIVRTGVSDAEIRTQLRYALGGFSTLNIDRRRHRKGRRRVDVPGGGEGSPLRAAADASEGTAGGTAGGTFVWRWDAGAATRDPVAFVEAYQAFLLRLHRDVTARMRELAGRATSRPAASQPLDAAAPSGATSSVAASSVADEAATAPSGGPGPRATPPVASVPLVGQSIRQLQASLAALTARRSQPPGLTPPGAATLPPSPAPPPARETRVALAALAALEDALRGALDGLPES
jgi:hypothetical protein